MPPNSVRTPEDHARWETCCELAWKMIYAEYPERLTQMANTLYYSDIPTL